MHNTHYNIHIIFVIIIPLLLFHYYYYMMEVGFGELI